MGDVIANLIMDEAFDGILLVSAHDCAAHMRVKWFGPKVPWVCRVAAILQ